MDKIVLAILLSMTVFISTANSSGLQFSGIETISVSGNFKSSPSPAPCFTDWNGDGTTDLLAAVYLGDGDSKDAAIQLYLNRGTNIAPDYNYSQNLKSSGSDIVPYFY